jgi:hypothetical protein
MVELSHIEVRVDIKPLKDKWMWRIYPQNGRTLSTGIKPTQYEAHEAAMESINRNGFTVKQ